MSRLEIRIAVKEYGLPEPNADTLGQYRLLVLAGPDGSDWLLRLHKQ